MSLNLIVRADDRLCALPVQSVVETMRPLPVQSHGCATDGVLGIAIVRGAPAPVIDLAAVLGGRASSIGRFVSLRVGQRVAVLAVAAVIGVAELLDEALLPLPPLLGGATTHAIEALTLRDAQLVAVLNAMRLVPEDAWLAAEAR